jgi:hypothetical protein
MTSLEEGLRLYYDWFLSNQGRLRETVIENVALPGWSRVKLRRRLLRARPQRARCRPAEQRDEHRVLYVGKGALGGVTGAESS